MRAFGGAGLHGHAAWTGGQRERWRAGMAALPLCTALVAQSACGPIVAAPLSTCQRDGPMHAQDARRLAQIHDSRSSRDRARLRGHDPLNDVLQQWPEKRLTPPRHACLPARPPARPQQATSRTWAAWSISCSRFVPRRAGLLVASVGLRSPAPGRSIALFVPVSPAISCCSASSLSCPQPGKHDAPAPAGGPNPPP